jgi:hypothetical protein
VPATAASGESTLVMLRSAADGSATSVCVIAVLLVGFESMVVVDTVAVLTIGFAPL